MALRNAHFALRVGYDGRPYCGWQVQGDLPTVAGRLAQACEALFSDTPVVQGASRTDSGVHARDQRVKISGKTRLDAPRLMAALNGRIEASIRVYTCTETDERWTPKLGVFGKSYRYRVWCGSGVPPLLEPSSWVRKGTDRLDLQAMNLAAAALIGEHDYDSFRSANCQAAHARRALWHVQAKRIDDHPDLPPDPGAGELIELEVRGNAFCHHQVRIIAGTLVDVGRGKLEAAALPSILQARDRRGAGITAPAQGLTLWRMYDLGDEAASGLPSGWSWPGAPWPQSP